MSKGYETRGSYRDFGTGSKRDSSDGKPRCELISPFCRLAFGRLMYLGMCKYGVWNFMKGQPSSEYRASLERHMVESDMGLEDEDHLAHALFNILGLLNNRELKKLGLLPEHLDDYPVDWRKMALEGGDPRYPSVEKPDHDVLSAALEAANSYIDELYAKLRKQYGTDGGENAG